MKGFQKTLLGIFFFILIRRICHCPCLCSRWSCTLYWKYRVYSMSSASLAMRILNFLVMISAVVAALLFVNAGVLYVMSSANPGNIAKAHKIFTSTLVGAVIIFASWLLINTVMSSLVDRGNSSFTGWNNLLCTGNMAASDPAITPFT